MESFWIAETLKYLYLLFRYEPGIFRVGKLPLEILGNSQGSRSQMCVPQVTGYGHEHPYAISHGWPPCLWYAVTTR